MQSGLILGSKNAPSRLRDPHHRAISFPLARTFSIVKVASPRLTIPANMLASPCALRSACVAPWRPAVTSIARARRCRPERRRCSIQSRDGKDDPRAGCGGHPPHPGCLWTPYLGAPGAGDIGAGAAPVVPDGAMISATRLSFGSINKTSLLSSMVYSRSLVTGT